MHLHIIMQRNVIYNTLNTIVPPPIVASIHNRRRDSIDSYHTSRVWIVVVMRSASGSELIGTIFFENKTIYDGVIVEAR